MNRPLTEHIFFMLMIAGALGTAAISPSLAGYLGLLLLVPVGGVLYATRTWPDRGFYLLCSGQPLVIACGTVTIWAGLFCAWMLAGMVQGAWGALDSYGDFRVFLLFCAVTFPVAAIIQLSNHVLLPLLVLVTVTGLVLFIQLVRRYQFRKQYTGAVS
jgi:hypothetical protein